MFYKNIAISQVTLSVYIFKTDFCRLVRLLYYRHSSLTAVYYIFVVTEYDVYLLQGQKTDNQNA